MQLTWRSNLITSPVRELFTLFNENHPCLGAYKCHTHSGADDPHWRGVGDGIMKRHDDEQVEGARVLGVCVTMAPSGTKQCTMHHHSQTVCDSQSEGDCAKFTHSVMSTNLPQQILHVPVSHCGQPTTISPSLQHSLQHVSWWFACWMYVLWRCRPRCGKIWFDEYRRFWWGTDCFETKMMNLSSIKRLPCTTFRFALRPRCPFWLCCTKY